MAEHLELLKAQSLPIPKENPDNHLAGSFEKH
jgi:hypothetical protein